jgi:hypothetical protein
VNPKDLEAVNGELYKNLTWMLCVLIVVIMIVVDSSFRHRENNITGVLEETFSVMEDRFNEHVVVELRLGGATQDLTEANKGNMSTSSQCTGSLGGSQSNSTRSWKGSGTCCHYPCCACSTSTSWSCAD